MLLSSVAAMFNAVVIQHFSFANAFNAIVNGFDISVLPKGFNLGPAAKDVTSLLNRGGHGEYDDPPDCVLYPVLRMGAFGPRGFEQDCGASAKDQKEHWLIDCRHPADRHPD